MLSSQIEYRSPSELQPRKRDFRIHSPDQIDRLCRSVQTYGFNQPVAIDPENRIVSGAGLVAAAIKLGLNRIPVIRLDHLSEAELRAYAIAVNKLADLGGYDEAQLGFELADIKALLGGAELPELGITTPELDRLFALSLAPTADADEVPEAQPARVISKPGQIWDLGRHRLLSGDALNADNYQSLMGKELAEFVISDVPYNLSAETISTTGRFDDFVQGSGEMTSAEFVRFLTTAMRHMAAWSSDGSIHMIFMSWHYLLELLRAGNIAYDELKTIITWVKPFPTLGSWYRSQTEFIAAFKHGRAAHLNNLGKNGRNRSTAWEYDGLAGFGQERAELLASHPTVKPVALIADAIRDCSNRGSIVLDPFAGSGTLAIAAEETGRTARMIEIDPVFVDVALRRFRKVTGIEPVEASSGATFTSLEEKEG